MALLLLLFSIPLGRPVIPSGRYARFEISSYLAFFIAYYVTRLTTGLTLVLTLSHHARFIKYTESTYPNSAA